MKIISFEVYNCTRFTLNKKKYFKITPSKNVILITGTNGSGKSSLIKFLLPNVYDKNDFKKDGYAKLNLTFNKSNYTLTYIKGKYSFYKDNLNLNDGGTKKVQSTLIEEHFRLTNKIHEILTEENTFTKMSIQDRKRWFSNISTIDYQYPIKVYNDLKTNLRDTIGGIKITSNRINEEKNSLLDKETLISLIKTRDEFIIVIDKMLSMKHIITEIDVPDINNLKDLTRDLTKMNNGYKPIFKSKDLISKVKNKMVEITERLNISKGNVSNISKQLEEAKENTDILNVDIESKVKKSNDLKELITNIEKSIYIKNYLYVYEKLMFAYPDLLDILNELSNFDNIKDNKPELLLLETRNTLMLNDLKKKLDNLLKTFTIQENYSKNKILECPSCNYKWKDGFKEEVYKQVKIDIGLLDKEIHKLEKELDNFKKGIGEINEKTILIENIYKYKDRGLEEVIKIITKNNPSRTEMSDRLFKVKNDLEEWYKVKELKEELIPLTKSIDDYYNIKNKLGLEHVKKVDILESRLNEELKSLTSLNIELNELNLNYKTLEKMFKLENDIKDYISKYNEKNKQKSLINHNNNIDEMVKVLRGRVGDMNLKIKDNDFKKDSIKRDEELLKSLNVKKKALSLVVKELSPTEGLIAKSILQFLNNFTNDMNNVIKSIWTYDMRVLPCSVTKDDLDYKFPINIEGTMRKDIKSASSGMQDIINLAFKLVSMRHLKMESYPIFLDEFGRTFDETHRLNAFNSLNKIINGSNQTFIISHFESMFGGLSGVNKVVLDNRNLNLHNLKEYNKIVEMK